MERVLDIVAQTWGLPQHELRVMHVSSLGDYNRESFVSDLTSSKHGPPQAIVIDFSNAHHKSDRVSCTSSVVQRLSSALFRVNREDVELVFDRSALDKQTWDLLRKNLYQSAHVSGWDAFRGVYNQHGTPTPFPRNVPVDREINTLVLDLNGVVCDKLFDPNRKLPSVGVHARTRLFSLVKRPGASEFLSWALGRFQNVVVWSSLRRRNVEEVLHALFSHDEVDRIAMILGNEDSPRDERYPEMREETNVAILKDLAILPELMKLRSEPPSTWSNILLCDDSERKSRIYPGNRVLVPSFSVDSLLDGSLYADRTLGALRLAIEIRCERE